MAYGSNRGREHPSTKGAFLDRHLACFPLMRTFCQQVPDPDRFENLSLRATSSTRYPSCRRRPVSGHFTHISTERTFSIRGHHLHLAGFLHTFMLTPTPTSSTGTKRKASTSARKVRRHWEEHQVSAKSEEEEEVGYTSANSQTGSYATEAAVYICSVMLSSYQSPRRKSDLAGHYRVDDRFV